MRGIQFLEPLFEFSGACGGCGETPYLRLLVAVVRRSAADRQRDRLFFDLWRQSAGHALDRRTARDAGPAWSNSLFEDNAEFGLGFRLAADMHGAMAASLLRDLAPQLGPQLVDAILAAPQIRESEILAQRGRVAELKRRLAEMGDDPRALDLLSVLDHLVRRSIWLVGGDGWAYDIGYGGLDHVLATGRDVNVLVLDTEVYSNTGGQASKATPLGAVAKFAAAGKRVARKDLALQAIAYGNVYVAQVAMGANPQQTLLAFREAEAWPGPSLILAYSHCIAHGFDLRYGMRQQDLAAASGYWPLFRFNPAMRKAGEAPFRLEFAAPDDPAEGLRLQRTALSQPGQHPAAGGRGTARARADRGDRKICPIRGARQPRRQPFPPRRRRDRRSEELGQTHGSQHTLSGARAAQSDHRVGLAALGRCRRHPANGRFRRRRRGPAVAVRGADRARGASGR